MYVVQHPIPQNCEEMLTRNAILAAELGQIKEKLSKVRPAATALWSVVREVLHRSKGLANNPLLHAVQ